MKAIDKIDILFKESENVLEEGWKTKLGAAGLAASLMLNPLAGIKDVQAAPQKIMQVQNSFVNNEIDQVSKQLQDDRVDIPALTYAILYKESSLGTNTKSRYEPGFQQKYGPTYRNWGWEKDFMQKIKSDNYKGAMKQFYSSYGPYQLMLPVAWELGFKVTPEELADKEVNRKVFVKFLKRRALNKTDDIVRIGDIYNGGKNKQYGLTLKNLYDSYKGK